MKDSQATINRYNAVKDRGRIYLGVFKELVKRYGKDEAISVMRSVSRDHGIEVGTSLQSLAPRDFTGMLKGYFHGPDAGAVFKPDVRQCDSAGLEVQMMRCPLKDAWSDAGCSDEEVCTLLHCATAFDEAVMETAGFDCELETWSPGRNGCCLMKITEKSQM